MSCFVGRFVGCGCGSGGGDDDDDVVVVFKHENEYCLNEPNKHEYSKTFY